MLGLSHATKASKMGRDVLADPLRIVNELVERVALVP
jgi:hypothetical protein